MNEAVRPRESPNGRILLLAGQAFALGLTLAWVAIPGNAIFLTAYGPDLLPVTYIAAGCAGALSSVTLAAAVRRRPLAIVASRVLAGVTALLALSWVLLNRSGTEWVSFALVVLVPIIVPVGFIFVVGQAGLLLDLRALKALYARVVAGFALGVVAGGLAGSPLLSVLGGPEGLVAFAAGATGLMLALVVLARHRYPHELATVEQEEDGADRPTFRTLARNRFVMLIVAFQVLSAVESQWLDFLVFDRAAKRYEDADELARFASQYAAIAYGANILFLLLLAGFLLRRFGLRYGLTINAIGVFTMLTAIIVTTTVQGSGATIVFVLIVAARVVDLTLADGAARTSLSAAYQAVPTRIRSVAQAGVEGMAVPVAIGLSGVALLLVDSAEAIDSLALPVMTGVVVIIWIGVAIVLYRDYGANLLASLRGRTLDPASLAVDDESTILVIDRLVESQDERDVRLGLDILTVAQHPELNARLERLAIDARVNVRTDALERLREVAPNLAATAARGGVDDPSPEVRAASVRVLGATRDASDVPLVLRHAADPSREVRLAVAFAVTRMSDVEGCATLDADIGRLSGSDDLDDRALAGLMLGECGPGSLVDRSVLQTLLADADSAVVVAGLAAVRSPDDDALLGTVADLVHDRRTAEAAVDALIRSGDAALEQIDRTLASSEPEHRVQELSVRVAREIGGPAAAEVLCHHLEHEDADVGLAVMSALASFGPSDDPRYLAVVPRDVEHATHVLRALVTFHDHPSAELLCAALRDELDLLHRRVIAGLSMRYGTDGLDRVAFQLAQRDSRSHALAIEWLDVTLSGSDRTVIPLLEPDLFAHERLQQLTRSFPLPTLDVPDLLMALVRDDDARWRPWIKACALHVGSTLATAHLDALTRAAEASTPPTGPEAELLHETVADLRARQLDLV